MSTNRQKGFSALEIIIIIAVVAVIGLVGWFVMRSNNDDKAAVSSGNSTAASDDTEDSGQGGDTKFLKIDEWGVEFALSVETADAYYDTKTSSPLDSMSLRVHSLDSEPDCTTAPQSVASIFRVPKDADDDMIPGKKYSETQDGKTIGGYFYFIQSSQYLCTDNVDKQIILQGVRNSFNTSSPSIQKS